MKVSHTNDSLITLSTRGERGKQMAKEDFCFTYYDGDAARDTTHMNRLERGAYHDLIISIRKFGHLTLDQIKKILGRDFMDCWGAVELIMKIDSDGKFFIDWLETSICKMRAQSKKQSENVTKRYQQHTNDIPKEQTVIPLEDGDGDGDGDVIDLNKKESDENAPRETRLNWNEPDVQGDEIHFPINTEQFKNLWAKWKEYRYKTHSKNYKAIFSEQAALKQFEGINDVDACRMITTAMGNGWVNLYPDKNQGNGKSNSTNKKQQQSANGRDFLKNHYDTKPPGNTT